MKTRMQHIRFFRLAVGERFDIGLVAYRKSSAFLARRVFVGALRRVMPWDKVRSTRPVKPEVPGWQKPFPPNMGQTIEHGPAYRGIMGCQGDGGDRTPESIGGNEKTPSA